MKPFNLDNALRQWRKKLNKYPGIEPGNAEELMSHLIDSIEEQVASGMSEADAFHKVTRDKMGDLEALSDEFYKTQSHKSMAHSKLNRSLATNFVKVALRNISKSRPHSYINLAGFAVGLASVIAISVYAFSELSFDRFHSDHERIFRVLNRMVRADTELIYPQGPPALAPALTSNFPEVELATRVRYADRPLIRYQEAYYYEDHAFFADSSFFKIFDFKILRGNQQLALNQPNTVVLTKSTAKKYFGEEDALNKMIEMDGVGPLQVTAVVSDVPHNSHFYFDLLISFQTYVVPDGYLEDINSWVWMGFLTYTKTHEGVNIASLEEKIREHYKASDKRYADREIGVILQPLADIYLGSSALSNPHNIFRVNSYTTLYSLMAVGLLIILIASFNYVNLSIAMSMSRFKEIAMRKVLGSNKGKLVFQFVMESVIYTLVSLLLALILVLVTRQLLPTSISSRLFLDSNSLMLYGVALMAFVTLIGIVSGIFPALRLASITSLDLLKGTFTLKEGGVRNVLIGFQFALSAALIAISLIIGVHSAFCSTKSLGFAREGVISLNVSSDRVRGNTIAIQNELKNRSDVQSLSMSSHIMGEGLSSGPLRLREQDPDEAIQMNYFQTDYDFLQVFDLQLIEGRFLSEQFPRDSTEAIVLNEAAIRTLGLSEPLGRKVIFTGGIEKEIVGVVKDFHFNSLHQVIAPAAIIMPFTTVENMVVRFKSDNIYRSLSDVEGLWKEVFPNVPFEITYMDDHLQSLYAKEELFGKVIQFFTLLATGIACLGLYSLAAISLAGKIKQISIRRVLGAPIQSILILSGRRFLLLVLIATLLSWPLVWYVMNIWLSGFAYHIDLSAWYFVATLFAIIVITILTMSYHLYKAVTVNPAEILRDN